MGWWAKFRGGEGPLPDRDPSGSEIGSHLRTDSPEFDLFVARGELQLGENLAHGARHLARLLSYAPSDPESLRLLEKYLEAAGEDPSSLFPEPESGKRSYDQEAVRALILARQGRLDEAVQLLVAVVQAKPDAEYLESWALDWLEAPGAVESLPPKTALYLLVQVLQRYPESRRVTAAQQRPLDRYADLAARLAFPDDLDEIAAMTRIGLLRKAGRFPEALQAAGSFVQQQPGWYSHTAEGLVRREMGDVDGALAAFQAAIEFRPEDAADRLEVADMFFDGERWEQAQHWYGQVLADHPEHPWALPSSLYCLWKQTDDQTHLDRLWKLLDEETTSRRAYQLYERFLPYVGFLPEPGDATANILRQLRERLAEAPDDASGKDEDAEFALTLTHLEAPSNRLAFRLMMEPFPRKVRLIVNVDHIPKPDPRNPCRPVKYLLWTYHETEPAPAIPEPRPDLVNHIARLAAEPYDYEANWASASHVAAQLETTDAANVLAFMVHPPPLPPGNDALEWVPKVQLATAHVLAHLNGDWHTSDRRDALLSALWGPMDWTTVAAIIAMTQLARHDPRTADDVREAFAILADHRPRGGYCCYEHALYSNWILLPGIPERERKDLQRKLDKIEKDMSH